MPQMNSVLTPLLAISAWFLGLSVLVQVLQIWSRREDHPALVRTTYVMVGLVLAQLALGLSLAYLGLTPPAQIAHLTAASLLLRDPTFTLVEIAQFLGHDIATLAEHYAHVIAELKGQPPMPVEQAIAEARAETPPERPQ